MAGERGVGGSFFVAIAVNFLVGKNADVLKLDQRGHRPTFKRPQPPAFPPVLIAWPNLSPLGRGEGVAFMNI